MDRLGRLPCVVPFCRGFRGLRKGDHGRLPDEWVCSRHWPGVSARLKARKRKAERLLRLARARGRDVQKFYDRAWAAWCACRDEAIERAVGIT